MFVLNQNVNLFKLRGIFFISRKNPSFIWFRYVTWIYASRAFTIERWLRESPHNLNLQV